jgi:hypothetical protein
MLVFYLHCPLFAEVLREVLKIVIASVAWQSIIVCFVLLAKTVKKQKNRNKKNMMINEQKTTEENPATLLRIAELEEQYKHLRSYDVFLIDDKDEVICIQYQQKQKNRN